MAAKHTKCDDGAAAMTKQEVLNTPNMENFTCILKVDLIQNVDVTDPPASNSFKMWMLQTLQKWNHYMVSTSFQKVDISNTPKVRWHVIHFQIAPSKSWRPNMCPLS